MATVAPGGAAIVPIKLHSHRPRPSSPFLGKKLSPRYSPRSIISAHRALSVVASGGEFFDSFHNFFLGVGVGLPCTVMECGDMIYRSTLPKSNGLTITAPGVALALAAVSYLWATPGVAPGFFDMFFLAFVERVIRPSLRKVSESFIILLFVSLDFMIKGFGLWRQDDIVLGKKLGEGAFGVVYRVSSSKKPSSKVSKVFDESHLESNSMLFLFDSDST